VPATKKSLRIPHETAQAVEEISRESGVDFSTATNQLLDEAVRMRRCPGIIFTHGPSGRRSTVAGTGIDVWEILATFASVAHDTARLRAAYHWLSDAQLRAALAYADLYPDDVDARRRRSEAWTETTLRRRHPALAPVTATHRKRRPRK